MAGRADVPPHFRFFGGKGGVGKTTCAAAAAITAARGRGLVLAVSTDPAHSLGDAVAVRLDATPRPVPGAARLSAVELDADRAIARWLRGRKHTLRTIGERGTYLDTEDLDRFLDLSLPGVDELFGLLELTRLAGLRPWRQVIVDTAPTGHTLRLLAMPETLQRIATVLDDMQAKHRVLAESLGGVHLVDTADRLIAELETNARALGELLRDPGQASFTWVMLPEPLALAETHDAVRALDEAGIVVREIVLNRVSPRSARVCAVCRARLDAERGVIAAAVQVFRDRIVHVTPAEPREPRGVAALRRLGRKLAVPPRLSLEAPRDLALPAAAAAGGAGKQLRAREHGKAGGRGHAGAPRARASGLRRGTAPVWLDRIVPRGIRLIIVGGKGGVGKTTCAAALALAIARRDAGRSVLLLSTDPAHSLGDVLQAAVGDGATRLDRAPSNLRVRELDAAGAFEARRRRYQAAVDEVFAGLLRGSRLDATYDRAVVRELIDLAPSGIDELFGVLAVVEALVGREDRYDGVVVDTAPTGHTLRLLSMPATARAWVRAMLAIVLKYRQIIGLGEFAAELVGASRDLGRLQVLLADRAQTRFVPVTRAAALPRLETARLVRALARLRVPVDAVIANALSPRACSACASISRAEARELHALRALGHRSRGTRCRVVRAPAAAPPPAGVAGIEAWSATWTVEDASS